MAKSYQSSQLVSSCDGEQQSGPQQPHYRQRSAVQSSSRHRLAKLSSIHGCSVVKLVATSIVCTLVLTTLLPTISSSSLVSAEAVTSQQQQPETLPPSSAIGSIRHGSSNSSSLSSSTTTEAPPFTVSTNTTNTTTTSSLNPLVIKGTKFFDSVTGEEVVIRGVDYYPRPNHGDLNLNSLDLYTSQYRHIWQRDIIQLRQIGVNAIRLYAVNASENHDEFMCSLEQAGMYVMVALAHDCPTCAITKSSAPDCYPRELHQQGINVINAFAKYNNTLAFSAGNEVNHVVSSPQDNAPCQKKFIADMRKYIASCSGSSGNNGGGGREGKTIMRRIPVGLVLADTDRRGNAMYYNCVDDDDDDSGGDNGHQDQSNDQDDDESFEHAEFYGLNTYVDCNGTATTYDEFLGLKSLQRSFQSYNYSIPVLLTEFGCLSDTFPTIDGYEGQRTFLEAQFLLERPELRDVFAGGFVFEYSIESENAKSESPFPFQKFGKQNYGLGYFSPEDCDDITTPCTYHPFPSTKYLRDAFDPSRIVNQINMFEYDPPEYRTGRSICPSSFQSLQSFSWETDQKNETDLWSTNQCPSHHELSSYTCPIQSSHQNWLVTEKGMIIAIAVGGVAMIVIIVSLLILFRRVFHQRLYGPKRGYEMISTLDTDGSSLSSSYSSDNDQGKDDEIESYQR